MYFRVDSKDKWYDGMKWRCGVRHGLWGAEGTTSSMMFCVWQQMAPRTCSPAWRASAWGPRRLLFTMVLRQLFESGVCERPASELICPHPCSHGLLHCDCPSPSVIWHSSSCQFSLPVLLENYFLPLNLSFYLKRKDSQKDTLYLYLFWFPFLFEKISSASSIDRKNDRCIRFLKCL